MEKKKSKILFKNIFFLVRIPITNFRQKRSWKIPLKSFDAVGQLKQAEEIIVIIDDVAEY